MYNHTHIWKVGMSKGYVEAYCIISGCDAELSNEEIEALINDAAEPQDFQQEKQETFTIADVQRKFDELSKQLAANHAKLTKG